MTDMMAALRHTSDHWQDSYHRLSEAHRRLQRVNQGLEDKLLRLADRSQSEKSALSEQADKLSTALTTAASAIHRLKGEKERLQQDLNIAIQLLQCNSSQYGKHKIDSLPRDLQQRVQVRLESEGGQQRSNSNSTTKAPDVRVIRVPIPTFPPTAMVYSLNKCDEDTPDEEEVQEAEDMVSAAIMAAVLEERQREQRHCPTCTCSPQGSSPHAASNSSGGRPSGGTEGGSGAAGCGANGLGPFYSNDGRKFAKGCAVLGDSAATSRTVQANADVLSELAKSVDLGVINYESKIEQNALQSESNLFVDSDKKSSNDLRTPVSAPLIDLGDESFTSVESRKNISKDKVTIMDLSKLSITEHFNSETMSNISVNKCICGRPYSQGANVIDVGTQTVPSYIGESGKVRSTCIYCRGHKIRDKAAKESKVTRPKRDVGRCVPSADNEKERVLCSSSPQLMRSCSDGESVSLMSNSSTADSSCSGDLNGNNSASDAYSSCSISSSSSLSKMNLANSSNPVTSAQSQKLDYSLSSPCSTHAWDWTNQTKKLSHVDSGSPSTPNSFVSSSCESGVSSASSPRHGMEDVFNDTSMKANSSSSEGKDDLSVKRFEASSCKVSKGFGEVHKANTLHRLQGCEYKSSRNEFASSSNSSTYKDPIMCSEVCSSKAQCLCKADVSTQCPLVHTVSRQAQTTASIPVLASDISDQSSCPPELQTEHKKPEDRILDSISNKLDDFSSLEVSTDLLARLTGHFDYLKDGLQEGMSQDSGIFSNSPVLNDKSIPYILDNFAERERVQELDLERNLLTSPYSLNPSASLKLKPDLTSTAYNNFEQDLSCQLNSGFISSLDNEASTHSHPDITSGRDKKKCGWAKLGDVTPSIHRPYTRCAPEERVVASTATASATVTSL